MYPGCDIHLLYDCSWTATLVCEQDVVVDDLELHATERHLATEMKSFSVIFLQFFTIATYKRFWNYIAVFTQSKMLALRGKVKCTAHAIRFAPLPACSLTVIMEKLSCAQNFLLILR